MRIYEKKFWVRSVRFIFVAVLCVSSLSVHASNSDPFRSGREAVNPKQSAGIGQSTGAMTYSYPIVIPPGRNGMQPLDLSLNYSSDDRRQDSIFGYGWSMNLPYIERDNKLGTNNLYNQDKDHTFFTSSLSGELLYVKNTTPIGGSLLGASQSVAPLFLLGIPQEPSVLGVSSSTSAESQITKKNDSGTVSFEKARSFHNWGTSPAYQYHPNEWALWYAARERAIEEAKIPVLGFRVVLEKENLEPEEFSIDPASDADASTPSVIPPAPVETSDVSVVHPVVDASAASTTAEALDTSVASTTETLEISTASTTNEALDIVTASTTETTATSTTKDITPAPEPQLVIPQITLPDSVKTLESLSAKDRANAKGQQIAALGSIEKTQRKNYSIEITSMRQIKSGVEVFARVWGRSGEPVGFGKDGTVEIERFRIFNPPVLVPDENGDVLREYVTPEGTTTMRFTLDPREALLKTLEHTIFVVGKSGDKIISGKVGNTTDTYYPDANPESTSVDGTAYNGYNASWATVHDAAVGVTGGAADATTNTVFANTDHDGGGYRITRGFFLFDTSAIDDTDSIDSATLSLYVTSEMDFDNDGQDYLNVYATTPASNTAIVDEDYDQIGTTAQAAAIDLNDMTTYAYNDWTLNSAGRGNISKTGITKFGTREGHDAENASIAGSSINRVIGHFADQAGTTNDPKLIVTHSATGPDAPTNLLANGLTNPSNVTASSPYFSAIHATASSTALAGSYRIQVATSTAFTSLYWDSGKQTLSSSTPQNQRTPNLYATTTFPIDGTEYYWRIKFWDQFNMEGRWSTSTSYFLMQLAGNYMAKVDDGSMMKYSLSTDGNWIAYDKKGWKYTFGATSNARIADPNTSSKIYRWYLEEIADPNGNKVLYRYKKDSGQVYPDYIDYTDRQGGSLYEVDFQNCDEVYPYNCVTSAYNATSSVYGFPIATHLQVSNLITRVNGFDVHKYVLNYGTGDIISRAILASAQETGYLDDHSGSPITLPATTFSYQTSSTTWAEITDPSSWQMNLTVSDTSNNDYGWRLFDVNGDALPDWVKSDGSSQTFLLNTGSKWSTSTVWTIPVAFSANNIEQGVRMADVNGDGLTDLIAASSTKVTYINNGASTWVASSTWAFPASFINSSNQDQGVQIVDINSDGLADVLQAYYASTTATTSAVYINNGHGWTEDTGWSIPEVLINDLKDSAVRVYDYNGDGLIDIAFSPYPNSGAGGQPKRVYYNSGRGWELESNAITSFEFAEISAPVGSADRGVRFADFNGDGCVDSAQSLTSITKNIILSFCGGSGGSYGSGTLPEYFRDTVSDYGVTMSDINGDGQIDITRGYYDSGTGVTTRKVYLKNSTAPDLLKEVLNSRGGKTTAVYQSSAQYKDSGNNLLNPNMPLVAQTLRTLTTDSGSYLGADRVIATTTYEYRNGLYYSADPVNREFSGFGVVIATTTDNNVTKTYFHQGSTTDSTNGEFNDHISKAGKPYRTEVYNQSGNLFARTINKWARADYGDGRNFVKLAQTLTQTFDGDSSHRDSAASTTYSDLTGDISVLTNYGEVNGNSDGTFTDTGTDLASTAYSYAASSTLAAMSLPSRQLLADQNGNTVKDTKWYYDSLASGLASFGRQTKEERLVSGTSYASTTRTYNDYGNVSTSTDPLGHATAFTYDAYDLYPTTVRNPLSQTRLYSYDYSLGKPATTTDENNQTFVTVFDSLDRPIGEKQPDITTPSTLVYKTIYSYTDSTTTPSSIFRTDYLSSATTSHSYAYLDGFDRIVKSKKEAESLNGWVTKDTVYNLIGSVGRESLPYFSSTSTYAVASATSSLFTTYVYDPMGRIGTTTNAVGTTTNLYNDWTVTTTDAKGNIKDFTKDTYGNLASVVEHNGSNYTTAYVYDRANNLTKITDALGNIRNFIYDKLGRRTSAEDLHASADGTFGTWTYSYDNAGNMTQRIDPKSQTVNWTYDALNRPLTEDYTGAAGTEVTYAYDSGTDGKTRLTQAVALNSATTTYAYNPLGQTKIATSTINNTAYATAYDYDRQGNQTLITYPDLSQVRYTYNISNLLDKVEQKENGGSFANIVSNFDYAPTTQPTTVISANGATTTNAYDENELYRLRTKSTLCISCGNQVLAEQASAPLMEGMSLTTPQFLPLSATTPSLSTDGLIKSTHDAQAWRKYHTERVAYLKTHPDLPKEALASALHGQQKFETYLLAKGYIKTPGTEVVTPLLSRLMDGSKSVSKKLLALLLPQNVYAYVFGKEDFESCSSLPCSFTSNESWGSVTPSLDIGSQVQGTKSLKEVISGEGGGSMKKTGLSTGEIWVQFKIKVPNPVTFGASGYFSILQLQDASGNARIWMTVEDYGTPRLAIAGNVLGYTDTGLNLTEGAVNTIEMRIKTGTSNGDVDIWLNNSTQGSPNYNGSGTMNIGTVALDAILVGLEYAPETGISTTYYDDIISNSSFIGAGAVNTAPSAPTSLQTEGQTNPENITDHTPEFSALYQDPDSGDLANKYRLQVATSSSFTSTYFDSGTTTMATTTAGQRSPDISYSGTALASSTTYYWRIKFLDDSGVAGDYSTTTATFTLSASVDTAPDTLQSLAYIYDKNGNITSLTDHSHTGTAKTAIYSYDALNRLLTASTTQASSTPYTHTYAYDALGNLTSSTPAGTYTYAGTNYANPHAATTINGTTNTYDNNGNLTGSGANVYTYDYQNRLVSSGNGTATSTYAYDHAGNRVKLTEGSTTTYFPNTLYSVTGSTNTKHIFANAATIATVESGSGGGTATPAYVQSAINSTTGAVTLTNPVTTGNLIIVGVTVWNTTIPGNAITDNFGNTYTKAVESINAGTTDHAAIFYAKNVTGGSSFTITSSVGGTISAHEYSGVDQTSPLDKTASSTGTSATPSSGNVTTALDNELYFGLAWSEGTGSTTAGSGYTLRQQETDNNTHERHASEDKVGSAQTTAATFSITASNTWAGAMATFKPGSGGGSGSTTIRYVHTDNLSGSSVVTDSIGNLAESLDYYPYGGARIDSKVGTYTGERKKFAGTEKDELSGLNFMQARYYGSSRGQFVSQDPVFWEVGMTQDGKSALLNPQAQNSYSYANGNPINKSDPNGRFGVLALFAIGAGVNVAAQGVEDMISGNPFQWQNYAGAAAGGVAGTATLLSGGGAVFTGAITSGIQNFTKQELQILSGKETQLDIGAVGLATGGGALFGRYTPQLAGVTVGRNSFQAITNQIATKLNNGTIGNFTAQTGSKILTSQFTVTVPQAITSGTFSNQSVLQSLSNQLSQIQVMVARLSQQISSLRKK